MAQLTKVKQNSTGGLMLFAAGVMCSIGGVCIRLSPWPPLAINGARGLIAAAITLFFIIKTKHKLKVNFATLACGLSLAMTMMFYCLANRMTSAAHAIMLMYTAPVFVLLYLWKFKRIKPSSVDGLTAFLVICGVALISFDGILSGSLAGDLVALLSGISYAGVFLANTEKNQDAISAYFFGQLFAGLCGAPSLLSQTDFGTNAIVSAILLGVFQLGIAYLLMAKGLEKTTPAFASVITAIEPVLSPAWVAIFYGETMSAVALIGAGLVVLSIITKSILPINCYAKKSELHNV